MADAVVSIRGDASHLAREAQRARRELQGMAQGITRDLTGAFRTLGVTLGAGLFANFIRNSARAIDESAKLADRLGIATEKLQALRFAARGAGVDVGLLDKALLDSQKRLAEAAATGNGPAAEWLERLNLNVRELRALSPDQLFETYSEAISRLSTRGEQYAAIQALMGKGTEELIGLIDGGSGPLRRAAEDIKALGIELTRVDAQQVENANDEIERLQAVTEGFGQRLAVALAPFVEHFVKGLIEGQKEAGNLSSRLDGFARKAFFAFEIAANAARVFDAAISGVVLIITELERRFLGALRSIAEKGAGLARATGLDGLGEKLERAALGIGNVEGFFASAAENARARVETALGGIKSFEQIGQLADQIVAEARRRAEEEVRNRQAAGATGDVDTGNAERIARQKELAKELSKDIEQHARTAVEQFRDANARMLEEAEYAATRRVELEFKAQEAIKSARLGAFNAGVGLLQAFAGRSKTAAIALVAINKAKAIAQAIQNTAVGATLQLTTGDPYTALARAAAVKAWGALQVGLIAATGYAEIQSIRDSAGPGAPLGSSVNPIFTQPTSASSSPVDSGTQPVLQVFINGTVTSEVIDELMGELEDAMGRGAVIIPQNSRQAAIIREGG